MLTLLVAVDKRSSGFRVVACTERPGLDCLERYSFFTLDEAVTNVRGLDWLFFGNDALASGDPSSGASS
jgi:hypothetical protein